MRRVGALAFLLGALALGALECAAAPYREHEIRFGGEAPPALGADPDDVALINTVAWLLSHKLTLPFPAGTRMYVYVNQATLVDGLITIARLKSEEAWELGRYAGAAATRGGVFVRGDLLANMPLLTRAGLFAHELTHVSQRKLGEGGRGRAAQWLLEGHADWAKFRVLDLLGFRPYRESRVEIERSVVRSPTPLKFFPDLRALAGNVRWATERNRLGAPATYGQAFLAVDRLVERYGHARVLEFLGRFARDEPTGGHWKAVFPVAYPQFEKEFRESLEALR